MFVRRMIRAFAGILFAVCLPHQAYALGLAEIELDSHLNEKFSATIELFDAEGLQPSEIIVSLAAREDFDRVGVERFFFLTNLRFAVERSPSGPVIKVTSAQPISEPYLNFLVEVLWPQGRLLKEYTVLLDPPTYTATIAAPEQERPRAAPAPRPQPAPRATDRGTQVGLTERAAPSRARGANMTTRNDTLWSVANRNRPNTGISVNQYMLAIQRANPDAFIDQNINLMKAGYVLDMPSESEALRLTTAQAAAEVSRQTDSWRGLSSRPAERVAANTQAAPQLRQQVTATSNQTSSSAAAQPESGTLQILAGEGDVAQGSSSGASAELGEENERLSREVDELTYQLDREKESATDQIAIRDRRLEVKDQELAALRQQLEQARAELDTMRTQGPGQTQTRQPEAASSSWMSPTVLLAAGAAALVLALLAALYFVRRRQQAEHDAAYEAAVTHEEPTTDFAIGDVADESADLGSDEPLDNFAEQAADPFDSSASADTEEVDALDFLDDLDDEPAADMAASEPEAGAAAPSLQTSDVIGEADIYAAYGRYPHAIGLLTSALDEDADRHDVRLKLLEVCVAAEDRSTFDTHLAELMERCSDPDTLLAARELEEGLPESDGDNTAAVAGAVALGGVAAAALSSGDDADEQVEVAQDAVTEEFDLSEFDDDDADDLLAAADEVDEVPQLEDLDELGEEVDALLSDLDEVDAQDDEFDLDFEDDPVAALSPTDGESRDDDLATELDESLGALAAGDEETDDLLDEALEELDAADDELDLGEDYAALGSVVTDDDVTDSLGGDLGMDFDPDAESGEGELADAELELGGDLDSDDVFVSEAELDTDELDTDELETLSADDDDAVSALATLVDEEGEDEPADELELDLDADDDLEIEDLLAELDSETDTLGEPAEAGADTGSAEILSFSRVSDEDASAADDDLILDEFADDDGDAPFGEVVAELDDDEGALVTADDDAADTKLDLAQAYIDMGDEDGARDILSEVLQEGNSSQRDTAQNLLDGLAS